MLRGMEKPGASSITISAQQLQSAISPQSRKPSLHLLEERRDKYPSVCVPLHKAAVKGDWRAAKHILEKDWTLVSAAITMRRATVLHVAVGANRTRFVDELVKIMCPEDLELQDVNGNTAFCIAAATGNLQIVQIMMRKNKNLPTIRGGAGITPLHVAALQGRREMAWYLYSDKTVVKVFEDNDWIILLFCCVNTGIYDLALELLEKRPDLAFKRDQANETILHILARKPLGLKQAHQLRLVKYLWSIFLTRDDKEILGNIRVPSHVVFDAIEVGNFEFLAVLTSTYPDLIWEVDERNRSIIHIAVFHRHANIFNLIQDIGPIKDFIASFLDSRDQSNLLHMAAKLAPQDRLNLVSGAAFQMTVELSWFEEVKKISPPSFIEMKNADGLTPHQLFIKEHKELLSDAESWMKGIANSCLVVSTLITIGIFSTTFNIPSGVNDNTGIPSFLQKRYFLIFGTSNAFAMISSSTSTVIFLSILISRYAEQDFRKSLPFKLISGLAALIISMISMMIAFGSAFFVTHYQGLIWVPSFISVIAFVPIFLLAFWLFPVWSDIVYSAYFCRTLFWPSKHMLYYG
ncbi:ankyrin repeat-containing protein ITN1-like isoform X2 [Prosopis cineraria]|uniref:ankyrin repeat-containing protein ITN1-like isoform X2 n=1 Tax=Prosopis cineraria TaxID=364024 RepID=UPI00240F3CDC|nr:ankyrin repeat-containing protein ITN1-like isoform X2 [Prosopis cineraria]